jgi:hypothetical protein
MTEPVSETPFKLLQLPQELCNSIYSHLDNGDAKSLRATCSAMGRDVPLRLTRVFLSANSLNINVFRAVANHKKFRYSVTEIIWDGARLSTEPCDLSLMVPTTLHGYLEKRPPFYSRLARVV